MVLRNGSSHDPINLQPTTDIPPSCSTVTHVSEKKSTSTDTTDRTYPSAVDDTRIAHTADTPNTLSVSTCTKNIRTSCHESSMSTHKRVQHENAAAAVVKPEYVPKCVLKCTFSGSAEVESTDTSGLSVTVAQVAAHVNAADRTVNHAVDATVADSSHVCAPVYIDLTCDEEDEDSGVLSADADSSVTLTSNRVESKSDETEESPLHMPPSVLEVIIISDDDEDNDDDDDVVAGSDDEDIRDNIEDDKEKNDGYISLNVDDYEERYLRKTTRSIPRWSKRRSGRRDSKTSRRERYKASEVGRVSHKFKSSKRALLQSHRPQYCQFCRDKLTVDPHFPLKQPILDSGCLLCYGCCCFLKYCRNRETLTNVLKWLKTGEIPAEDGEVWAYNNISKIQEAMFRRANANQKHRNRQNPNLMFTMTADALTKLCLDSKFLCAMGKQPVYLTHRNRFYKLTLDHIEPRHRRRPTTYCIENIQLMSDIFNHIKGTYSQEEMVRYVTQLLSNADSWNV